MEIGRSFRLQRDSSMRLGRSNSSLLLSESITAECARITSYERLSESMRLSNECNSQLRRKNNRTWRFLSKVFSYRKVSEDDAPKEKTKKQASSSWLPDPNRRWPVQGW